MAITPELPEDDERLAYRPAELARLLGCSRSVIYEQLAGGHLVGRKLGASTLITRTELLRWLDSLPTFQSQDH